jgi:hypothetical protein
MDRALPDGNPASRAEQLLIANATAALLKLAGHCEAQRAGVASAQHALSAIGHGNARLDFRMSLGDGGVRVGGALVSGDHRRVLIDAAVSFDEGALALALGLRSSG